MASTTARHKSPRSSTQQIVDSVVPVSSTTVAEMVKLLENTFRAVNIGLANELALMCRRLDVDVWEVIEAAKTKAFGFMPFYPGPGLGGHCIPIDPFYLSWKAKQNGFESRFIELAGHINSGMPRYVVERIVDALNTQSKAINGSAIHLFGVSYKPDVGDIRESPAIDIALLLQERGARLSYSDPHVPRLSEKSIVLDAGRSGRGSGGRHRLRRHHNQPSRLRLCRDRASVARRGRHTQRVERDRRRQHLPVVR